MLLILAVFLPGVPGSAMDRAGPWLATEQVRAAAVHDSDGQDTDSTVTIRRQQASLLLPVPAAFLGGMALVRGELVKEYRDTDPDPQDLPEGSRNAVHPGTGGLGLAWLPHVKEGAPGLLFTVQRYGSLTVPDRFAPMQEYMAGITAGHQDLPFSLCPAAPCASETRLILRLRRFPGPRQRWLVLAGHHVEGEAGYSMDVLVPSHALVGWNFRDRTWKVYAGIRMTDRAWPFSFGDEQGWVDGYAESRLVGVRAVIAAPLYVSLEGGVLREELSWYRNRDGERLGSGSTGFAPWVRIAAETWIRHP